MDHALVVLTDCMPGSEAEFNEWYDTKHVPEVLASDGFVAVQRYELADAAGDRQPSVLRYFTVWEIEGDLAAALESFAAGADRRTPRPPSTVDSSAKSWMYAYSVRSPRVVAAGKSAIR